MNFSHWEKESLCDPDQILVIGCGIVGLTTAIHIKLMNSKIPVTVLERSGMPEGASTKNAGFACFGSVSEIVEDLKTMSRKEVVDLVKLRYNGLKELRSLVGDSEMDYSESGGYEMFLENEGPDFDYLQTKVDYCNEIVEDATGMKNSYAIRQDVPHIHTGTPFLFNRYEGQLNPFKMVNALRSKAHSLGIQFVFNATVRTLLPNKRLASLENGTKIPFRECAICTNGFARKLLSQVSVIPARNQVMITEPIDGPIPRGCFHFNKGYVYFRDYGNRILLGGGRHIDSESEVTDEFGINEKIRTYLLNFMSEIILPDRKYDVSSWWSGILGVGENKTPVMEEVEPGIHVCVRLGGMGVAIGTMLGKILARRIVK